ncbi:MAG: tetratricopeptide repeat protein, partial [Armatimonadota bacterium]
AQDVLGKALNLDGSNPEALLVAGVIAIRSGQTEAALTALGKAAAAPSPDYRALAYLSTVQLAQKQPQEALASARKAVALAPASALAHESLGTAAFFSGSTAEAAAETALALELNPQSATAHLLASDLAVAQGDLDGGMAEAEAAVELDPRLAPAHQAIGMIALAQNDLKRAEKAFGKALALQPKLVAARTGMGMTYSRQGKLAQALEQQEGAAALDSSSAAVQNNMGMIYLQTGRLDQAIATLKATERLQPDWAIVKANLALAYLESNQYAQALSAAEKAVKLGGDSARVRTTLARVYLRQGRTNAAWAQLRRALELDPNYALARLHLAEVYMALGRPEDATRERFKALSLQPSVMVDSREYARTELEGSAGNSFFANAKTMGRGDDGQNAYYVAAQTGKSDAERPRTTAHDTTVVGIAGRQTAADETAVLYATAEIANQDRPGAALPSLLPTDPDYSSKFRGAEAQVLTRRGAGRDGDLTLRLGWRRSQQRNQNPDALSDDDPKPFQRLEQIASGPMAEFRLDQRIGQHDLLTVGAAWMARRNEISGLLGSGDPPVFSPFKNSDVREIGAGYVEFQRLANDRTQWLVGGRIVAANETTAVIRPKALVRRQVSKTASVTLLTRPVLADDVSELAPVDPYALRSFMSPTDLARGGYSQSYELQYESTPPSGVLRVAIFQRDVRNLLVDLEDPAWSLEAAPL